MFVFILQFCRKWQARKTFIQLRAHSVNVSHYFPFLASAQFQSGHSYFPDVNDELWAIWIIWRILCRQQNCKIDIIFNLNWGWTATSSSDCCSHNSLLARARYHRAVIVGRSESGWNKMIPSVQESRHQLFLLRRQFPGHFLNWNFICSTITIWNVSLNGGYNYYLGDTILGSISHRPGSDKSQQKFPNSFSPGGNTLLMNSEPQTLLQGVKLTNAAVANCRQPIVIKQFIIGVLLKEIKMPTNCWEHEM